jgi:hypothetical protein
MKNRLENVSKIRPVVGSVAIIFLHAITQKAGLGLTINLFVKKRRWIG